MRDRHVRTQRLGVLLGLGLALALLLPGGALGASLHPSRLAKVGYGTVPIGFARTADGRLHVAFETNTNWGDSASGVGLCPSALRDMSGRRCRRSPGRG
jgi:hypothetical protein